MCKKSGIEASVDFLSGVIYVTFRGKEYDLTYTEAYDLHSVLGDALCSYEIQKEDFESEEE